MDMTINVHAIALMEFVYSAFPSVGTEEITIFVPKESAHMFTKAFFYLKKICNCVSWKM